MLFENLNDEVNLDALLQGAKEEENQTPEEQNPADQVSENDTEESIEETTKRESTEEYTELNVLYDYLLEKGHINTIENLTEEELEKSIDSIPDIVLNRKLQQYPEEHRKVLKHIINGVSIDEIKNYFTPKTVEEQSKDDYLKSKFRDKFLTEEEVNEHIEVLKAEDKFEKYFEHFKSKDKEEEDAEKEKQLEEVAKAKAERDVQINSFNTKLKEEFENATWDSNVKEQVAKVANSKSINEISSKIFQNPKAFLELSLFLSKFDMETGEFNLDSFAANYASKLNKKQLEEAQKNSFSSKIKAMSGRSSDRKTKKKSLFADLVIED